MVSKERLGGFIDGIVAVIMTIMLLEFRLPATGLIGDFFKENLVYLVAYGLSFIYVITSWFNQQYMLMHATHITRKIYFSCMLWVLSLSLLPVLAAWTGRTINIFHDLGRHSPQAPALLFLAMIFLWGVSYAHMANAFIADNPKEKAEIIQKMEVYQYLRHPIWRISMILAFIITFFYPPFVFIYTAGEMTFAVLRSRNQTFL
ncbi:TMEM175 family protein [Lactococcus nasutitermitis]|uniref:TMEM175 family protein n=1 Tax=Lactococcus nasutitermitis TaxID=1652957 RepID=A0ABV9JB26_9LACT|nr:TMEM175 family protein [Lactococcus nasutitermitis]